MSDRILKALARAHFKTVCGEMERECLTYSRDDEGFDEHPRWTFKEQLADSEPAGGWVN